MESVGFIPMLGGFSQPQWLCDFSFSAGWRLLELALLCRDLVPLSQASQGMQSLASPGWGRDKGPAKVTQDVPWTPCHVSYQDNPPFNLSGRNTEIGFGELLATVQGLLRFSVQKFGGLSGFILIKEGADEVSSKAGQSFPYCWKLQWHFYCRKAKTGKKKNPCYSGLIEN